MKQTILMENPWWDEGYTFNDLQSRGDITKKIRHTLNTHLIAALVGLRRIGKTTLMKLIIKDFIDSGINRYHILYLSLDFIIYSRYTLPDILEEYRRIHKVQFKEKIYLFLDEITYFNNWQQQLKNLYDLGNYSIVITSSSSSVLKDEKAFLTGRTRIIEIPPLTFDEFLSFKNIKLAAVDEPLHKEYFEEYLATGGIPHFVIHKDNSYLEELIQDIIRKDVMNILHARDTGLINDFFLLLMERSGKQFTLSKIAKILNKSKSMIQKYFEAFESTMIINVLERYGTVNERLVSPKKIYTVDLGIRNTFTGFRDKGALFENYIYNLIKHKRPFYYNKNGIELDFITDRFKGEQYLIESKYHSTLNPKQKALFDEMNIDHKIIIHGFEDLGLLKGI